MKTGGFKKHATASVKLITHNLKQKRSFEYSQTSTSYKVKMKSKQQKPMITKQASSRTSSNRTDEKSSVLNKSLSKKKRPTRIMLVGSKAFKVSCKLLSEIKQLQSSTKLLIPKMPFGRFVHEVLHNYGGNMKIQSSAMSALQEATEAYIVQFLEDCYYCALHSRRSTLIPRDIGLMQRLRSC